MLARISNSTYRTYSKTPHFTLLIALSFHLLMLISPNHVVGKVRKPWIYINGMLGDSFIESTSQQIQSPAYALGTTQGISEILNQISTFLPLLYGFVSLNNSLNSGSSAVPLGSSDGPVSNGNKINI